MEEKLGVFFTLKRNKGLYQREIKVLLIWKNHFFYVEELGVSLIGKRNKELC